MATRTSTVILEVTWDDDGGIEHPFNWSWTGLTRSLLTDLPFSTRGTLEIRVLDHLPTGTVDPEDVDNDEGSVT